MHPVELDNAIVLCLYAIYEVTDFDAKLNTNLNCNLTLA